MTPEPEESFGADDLAVLGINPLCGCPLAIDMSASPSAVKDFENAGLLIQFLSPSAASRLWDEAEWPCKHKTSLSDSETSLPLGAEGGEEIKNTIPFLRLVK
jgi:hypothetical protein